MDKKKKVIIISVIAILLIALIVGIVIVSKKQLNPEEAAKVAVETYVTELGNRNVDGIVKVIDGKGMYAWNKYNENTEEFIKEYNKVESNYTESYENILKVAYTETVEINKAAYTKYTAKASEIKTPEKVAEGLYKVSVTIDETFEQATGDKFVANNEKTFYVYNGKIVSISDENPFDLYDAKTAIEKYISANNEGNLGDLLEVVDLKGQVAYSKDMNNFKEVYNSVSDAEMIEAEKIWAQIIGDDKKGFEAYRMELAGNIEYGNKGMSEDIIYAKAPVTITYVEKQDKKEDVEEKVEEGSVFVYLYNGNIIGIENY